MKNTELLYLFEKYRNNKCSPDEVSLLLAHFRKNSFEQEQLMDLVLESLQEQPSAAQMTNKHVQSAIDKAYLNIVAEISDAKRPKYTWKPWIRISAAAAVLIIIAFFFFNNPHGSAPVPVSAENILPGGHKAVLKLADGKTIHLSDQHSGIIMGSNTVKYNNGSAIPGQLKEGLMTISTPRGGEYQIVLADGTKVWLNAATTLQYSADLRERGKRKVKLLVGEAYFEVSKDKEHPFIVETPLQEVEVLGTHFNINSYSDEGRTVTTLTEGSVKVSYLDNKAKESAVLKPGMQSVAGNGKIKVQQADLQTELAWKEGKIYFRDAPIQEVLRQVSRWYNIEVEYEGEPTKEVFNGGIKRTANLSSVLRILELSNVHFALAKKNNITTLKVKQTK